MDTRKKILLSCLIVTFFTALIIHDEIVRRHVAVKGISTEKKTVSHNKSTPDQISTQSTFMFGIEGESPTPAPEVQSTSASQDSSASTSNSTNQSSNSGGNQTPTPNNQKQISITPTRVPAQPTPTPTSAQVTTTPTPTPTSNIVVTTNGAFCTNQIGNTCVEPSNSANVGNSVSTVTTQTPTPTPVTGNGASSQNSATVTQVNPVPTSPDTGGNTTVFTGTSAGE